MFTETTLQRVLLFVFRVSIGWVFLGAALRQLPSPDWSAAGFMSGSPNFSGFFELMATPPFLTIIDFVIPWAHLLIGLALILGICMKLGALGGAILMILYYIPRFEFPGTIVEYHLIYALLIVYLAAVHAGRIWGLEGVLSKLGPLQPYVQRYPLMRQAIG